jgi:hypothetical protein
MASWKMIATNNATSSTSHRNYGRMVDPYGVFFARATSEDISDCGCSITVADASKL